MNFKQERLCCYFYVDFLLIEKLRLTIPSLSFRRLLFIDLNSEFVSLGG